MTEKALKYLNFTKHVKFPFLVCSKSFQSKYDVSRHSSTFHGRRNTPKFKKLFPTFLATFSETKNYLERHDLANNEGKRSNHTLKILMKYWNDRQNIIVQNNRHHKRVYEGKYTLNKLIATTQKIKTKLKYILV